MIDNYNKYELKKDYYFKNQLKKTLYLLHGKQRNS